MASKSKKRDQKKVKMSAVILLSAALGSISLYQNWYGDLSDIRLFYSLHFYDGQHIWPYSEKILIGRNYVQHPVEYPAVTGLIMWLISFLILPSDTAAFSYYRITAIFQVCIFSISTYLILKLSNFRYARYFAFTPAVLYSLNRNWDIWAIATMLLAIYLFEKKRFQLSAMLLAVSISTKFFPIVLILPIMIILLRAKKIKILIHYLFITLISWFTINLPFILVNFEGWFYFYKFSAERGLGSASIYELLTIILPSIEFNIMHFYIFNSVIVALVIYFFLKLNSVQNLTALSFFVMFGFMIFNKQYSMQYVLWLSALAVVSISYINKQNQNLLVCTYILWQIAEIAFQYSYFQKLLTDTYANSDTPMTIAVSSKTYAYIGIARYFLAVIFTLTLARFLVFKNNEDRSTKNRVK